VIKNAGPGILAPSIFAGVRDVFTNLLTRSEKRRTELRGTHVPSSLSVCGFLRYDEIRFFPRMTRM
jgi:hypothetical protein